ncbi:hypothetical protein [Plantactinospora sp. GCM10030261]|uniref:hypothetical protein n=1 Tax=Plantactinospora sp. GCM10030261 TaxID=3273420 RepID=UPI0036140C5A
MDGRRDFSAEQRPSWYPDDRGYDGDQWHTDQDRYAEDNVLDPRDHDRAVPDAARYADPSEASRSGAGYSARRHVDPTDPLGVGTDPGRGGRPSALETGVPGRGGRPSDLEPGVPGRLSDTDPGRLSDTDPGRSGGFGRAAEFPVIGGGRPGDVGAGGRPGDRGLDSDDGRRPGRSWLAASDPAHPTSGATTGQLPIADPDGAAARFHTQPIDRQDLQRPGPGGPGVVGGPAPASGPAPVGGPGSAGGPGPAGPLGAPSSGVYGAGSGNESVYRSRRPVHAIVLVLVTVVLEIVALRVLLTGVTASPVTSPAVVSGALLMLGLPIFAMGLYGVATGAAALTDAARAWLRPPAGYLVAGLVLLLSAAIAVG